jgi:hypothetical protein
MAVLFIFLFKFDASNVTNAKKGYKRVASSFLKHIPSNNNVSKLFLISGLNV